jgi:hypothetical protein
LNETDSFAIFYSISLAEDAAGSYLTSDVKVTLNDATAKIASTSLESYMGYEDYATDVVVLRIELGTGLDILKAIEMANNPVIPPVEGDGTQNGDAPTVDDAPQNQESESPINPVVVGGIAVAAVGGTAGAVLAIRRKK